MHAHSIPPTAAFQHPPSAPAPANTGQAVCAGRGSVDLALAGVVLPDLFGACILRQVGPRFRIANVGLVGSLFERLRTHMS
jgi:hypothetical protein